MSIGDRFDMPEEQVHGYIVNVIYGDDGRSALIVKLDDEEGYVTVYSFPWGRTEVTIH